MARAEPTTLGWAGFGAEIRVPAVPGGVVYSFRAAQQLLIGDEVEIEHPAMQIWRVGTVTGAIPAGVVVGGKATKFVCLDRVADAGTVAASTGQLVLVCVLGIATVGVNPLSATKKLVFAGVSGSGSGELTDLTIRRTGATGLSNWIAVGSGALDAYSESAGSGNIAIGTDALASATIAQGNIAIGAQTQSVNVLGANNIAIGDFAMQLNVSDNNIAIGTAALQNNTSGNGNVAIGVAALKQLTVGVMNTAVGAGAMQNATTATHSTAIGEIAMLEWIAGANNVAVGVETMHGGIAGDQFGPAQGSDGGFDTGAPYWTWGTGWTHLASAMSKNADGTGTLEQASLAGLLDYGVGGHYTVTVHFSSFTVGTVTLSWAGVSVVIHPGDLDGSGNFTWHAVPTKYPALPGTADVFKFTPSNTSRFTIDQLGLVGTDVPVGDSNTAVGTGAGYFLSLGHENCAYGLGALRQAVDCIGEVAVGCEAMLCHGSGQYNVALGRRALYFNNVGSRNVALGAWSGYYEMGSDNLYINTLLRADAAAELAESLVVGKFATSPADQWLRINGLVDLTSRGQLKFPTTNVSSADPHTFDDYEEGTWTPAFTGSGGQSGQVHAGAVGHYTKIGRVVLARFDVQLSTLGTITGNAQISGFPFPPVSGATAPVLLSFWSGLTTAVVALSGLLVSTATDLGLYKLTAATANSAGSAVVQADLSNTTRLMGVVIYHTE